MAVNEYNGKIEGETKVSELVDYLQKHMSVYGDTSLIFMIEGERSVNVQFEHFKDALTIDIEEEYED